MTHAAASPVAPASLGVSIEPVAVAWAAAGCFFSAVGFVAAREAMDAHALTALLQMGLCGDGAPDHRGALFGHCAACFVAAGSASAGLLGITLAWRSLFSSKA
jgi:hypothetical protein